MRGLKSSFKVVGNWFDEDNPLKRYDNSFCNVGLKFEELAIIKF